MQVIIYVVVEELERYCQPTNRMAFKKIEDAIAHCEKIASEEYSGWVRNTGFDDDFSHPSWKSSEPIHSKTYAYDFMTIKEVVFNLGE